MININIIFIGDVLPQNIFKEIANIAPSTNNIELDFVTTLHSEFKDKLTVISKNFRTSILSKNKSVQRMELETSDGIKIITVGFMQAKILKTISGICNLKREIKHKIKEIKKNNRNEPIIFFIVNPYYQQSLPIYLSKRKKDAVVTVMLEALDSAILSGKVHKSLYDKFSLWLHCKLYVKNDGNIVFCKSVAAENAPNVPILQIYPTCDPNCFCKIKDITENKGGDGTHHLLYAGMLSECYGIDRLVSTMSYLPDNYILHICGNGEQDIVSLVKNASQQDERIIYHGLINRDKVIRLEKFSEVLFMIRVSDTILSEYQAKYLVPSKVSEYLMSGTPIIATKIPSINNELDQFLNYTTDDPKEIARIVIDICDKNNDRYKKQAEAGIVFALQNCTRETQQQKIINFIKTTIKNNPDKVK